jgi:hypothetical protein
MDKLMSIKLDKIGERREVMSSGELVAVGPVVEAEIVEEQCQLRFSRCTNRDVQLLEDVYESDVNNTPGRLLMLCPNCAEDNKDAI